MLQMRDTAKERLREQAAASASQGGEVPVSTTATRSRFGATLDVLQRLSASYRRCYWKSGAEMLFPILFGHMTFASHRCWTVYVKKGVYLAAEAWRQVYGRAVRHAALRDGGGTILQYVRHGMDPYPMPRWKRIELSDGQNLYEGPNGELYEDLHAAYEHDIAAKAANTGVAQNRVALDFLQRFLKDSCSETEQREDNGTRFAVTTSTLEDWLHRGDHPILAPMSLLVYAMWVFRVEKPRWCPGATPAPRFIDIDFATEYALRTTHRQRLATEFRVPLWEGFSMPSSNVDSETAALYKQLLLRPLSVPCGEAPADQRLVEAFTPLCSPGTEGAGLGGCPDGARAFTHNWLRYSEDQEVEARRGFGRFLLRYEWPSLWETAEVQTVLHGMWTPARADAEPDDLGGADAGLLDPVHCHDRGKPRATVAQYTALLCVEVAANLEGLARARLEKRPRQYQSDASVHQAYMRATSGGGETAGGEAGLDFEGSGDAPQTARQHFERIPWGITNEEAMRKALCFGYRIRLTPFAKELMELKCMEWAKTSEAAAAGDQGHDCSWMANYHGLHLHGTDAQLELLGKQAERLDVSHEEDDMDIAADSGPPPPETLRHARTACFADQEVYKTPGAYIMDLVQQLPDHAKLTRGQTLFMLKFADICDQVWKEERENTPPRDRRVHHILLLGQGGSGKTHVVQNLVFKAVAFIWPPTSSQEPTLMVVATSNAQAKNISTVDVKARTLHNASGMRVQQLVNQKMRPGNKQAHLTRLWNSVRVLVIEEISMVAAASYNMLDYRSMCGRISPPPFPPVL